MDIEITAKEVGRSPHGERGLKFRFEAGEADGPGRSPHGERGLKS